MSVIARDFYANTFGNTSSNSFNLEAMQGKPYSFVELTKDEVSIAFRCIHRTDTVEREMPLGTRTFIEDNYTYWSRCAKGQLAEIRMYTARLKGVDTSHSNGKKYAEEINQELALARKTFRQALLNRREKHFLNTSPISNREPWEKQMFNFCTLLLTIHRGRCDNNFVGQMIDRLVTPLYHFIADTKSNVEKDLDETQAFKKVKTIAAFVVEDERNNDPYGYRWNILRYLKKSECRHAAQKLGIEPIYNQIIASLEVD